MRILRYILVFLLLGNLPAASVAQDSLTLEVLAHRRYLDSVFRSESSPLKEAERANFKGFSYFEVDTNFRVWATYKPLPDGGYIHMKVTKKGRPQRFRKSGEFIFTLEGKEFRLFAYQSMFGRKLPSQFFVPFYDQTSGKETYGGGRYLDVYATGERVLLDFNYTYAPYCAHSNAYECPIPPKENRLKIKILAGERNGE